MPRTLTTTACVLCSCLLTVGITPLASAADDPAKVQLTGRLQLGYAVYQQDVAPLQNGGEARRARLKATGAVAPNTQYALGVDFASGDAKLVDALVRFTGLAHGTLTAGQFKQPFSLSYVGSACCLSFIERPLPVLAFGLGRRLGASYEHDGDAYTFSVAGFGQNLAAEGDGVGAATRLTFAPVHAAQRVVHLGISGAFAEAPDASNTVRLRARPESHVTDLRLVDTGLVTDVNNTTRLGLEAATVLGPFSVQGEYLATRIHRRARPNADVNGYYVFASWFLTGESRPYAHGKFGRVTPLSDSGAIELALRYSTLNLDNGAIQGGRERNLTLAVNYYLTSRLKFQANYTWAHSTRRGLPDNPRILQFQLACDFG